MKNFKIEYAMCTECFSAISTGQANATNLIFGASMCVKCASGHTKFDVIKGVRIKTSQLETII
jgi:hypothetical protein